MFSYESRNNNTFIFFVLLLIPFPSVRLPYLRSWIMLNFGLVIFKVYMKVKYKWYFISIWGSEYQKYVGFFSGLYP